MAKPNPIVIGIDPGSRFTGYGVISQEGSKLNHIASGVIVPPPKDSFEKRLHYIYVKLTEVVSTYQPRSMAVESIFYSKNIKSMVVLAHARAIALLVAAEMGIPMEEYSPLEVKKAVVGYGRAEKPQVFQMMSRLFRTDFPPTKENENATDALAVALCHLNRASLHWKAENSLHQRMASGGRA